jgi:hydroxymethylbilane synthase
LEGEIDLATHSLKDLPVREPQGLCIAAIPLRADPADALVSLEGCGLDGLPPGAVIGTSSLRRRAQILNFRPDLVIEEMRGNVDTRLRKLEQDPDLSGLIVAAAAMERLGFERRITQRIPFHICLPAPGQGAISVEAREDDAQTLAIARAIDHPASHAEVRAERALVQAMGADCRDPLGALGRCTGERLALEGVLAAPDGQALVRARVEGDCAEPEQLGREAAERLRAGGAEEIMRQLGDRPSRGDL